jgi:hypothetical protein
VTSTRPRIREVYDRYLRGEISFEEVIRFSEETIAEWERLGVVSPDPTVSAAASSDASRPPME